MSIYKHHVRTTNENWDALSETSNSGKPWRANGERIAPIAHVARIFEPTRANSSSSRPVEDSADPVAETRRHHATLVQCRSGTACGI